MVAVITSMWICTRVDASNFSAAVIIPQCRDPEAAHLGRPSFHTGTRRDLQLGGGTHPYVVVYLISHVELCNPMDYSMSVFPILHYLPEFVQIYVH